jgi:superfamily II helicase
VELGNTKSKTLSNPYPVLCSWCLRVGRKTIISWSATKHSRGICKDCQKGYIKEETEYVDRVLKSKKR